MNRWPGTQALIILPLSEMEGGMIICQSAATLILQKMSPLLLPLVFLFTFIGHKTSLFSKIEFCKAWIMQHARQGR